MTIEMQQPPIRIALIDDHAIIHDGISGWSAQAEPPIALAGSYLNVPDFDAENPMVDVVVLDLQFETKAPDLTAIRRLADDGRRIIIFSQHTDSRLVLACLELGAVTYLSKAEGREHLISAIREAATDRPYLSPTMAKAFNNDDTPSRPTLSKRENEVLVSWFQTDSKALVAKRLYISEDTVKSHLRRIRTKYAAAGRPAPTKAALVARAIQDRIVDPDEL